VSEPPTRITSHCAPPHSMPELTHLPAAPTPRSPPRTPRPSENLPYWRAVHRPTVRRWHPVTSGLSPGVELLWQGLGQGWRPLQNRPSSLASSKGEDCRQGKGPCGPRGAMAESAHKFFSRFGNVAGNLRNSITEFAADVLETAEELSQQVERTPDAPAAAPAPAPAPGPPQGDAMMTRLAALRSRIAAERARSGCARCGPLRFECGTRRRLALTPLRGRRQERGEAAGGGARREYGARSGRCAARSAHLVFGALSHVAPLPTRPCLAAQRPAQPAAPRRTAPCTWWQWAPGTRRAATRALRRPRRRPTWPRLPRAAGRARRWRMRRAPPAASRTCRCTARGRPARARRRARPTLVRASDLTAARHSAPSLAQVQQGRSPSLPVLPPHALSGAGSSWCALPRHLRAPGRAPGRWQARKAEAASGVTCGGRQAAASARSRGWPRS